MTAEEMSNVFDIRLNSYVNQHFYGNQQGDTDFTCDEYEKSLFLTKAQEEVVKSLYTGKNASSYPSLNIFMKSFEETEEFRRILATLIHSFETDTFINDNDSSLVNFNVSPVYYNSLHFKYVRLPKDLLYITTEGAMLSSKDGDECVMDYYVDVVPVTQDELHKTIRNPFRGLNKKRVFRLDVDTNKVELISRYLYVSKYYCRYLRKPSPIITTKLPQEVAIDGNTDIKDCELSTSIHDTIVDIAAQLAYQTKLIGRQSTTQSD